MSFMDKLFSGKKLSALKSASDFDTASQKLEAELRQAIAERDGLASQQESAMFAANGNLSDIRAQIRDIDERIELLTAALGGSRKRLAEAQENERQSIIEAKMSEARALYAEQRELCILYDCHATAIADTLRRLREISGELTSANIFATQNGRPDLKVPSIFGRIRQRLHALVQERRDALGIKPDPTDFVPKIPEVPDPSSDPRLALPGYWTSETANATANAGYHLATELSE